jgi:hypothetical protein
MELFRYRKTIWGQEILSGVSWDLIWVFIGAAIAFIIAHLFYLWLSK